MHTLTIQGNYPRILSQPQLNHNTALTQPQLNSKKSLTGLLVCTTTYHHHNPPLNLTYQTEPHLPNKT